MKIDISIGEAVDKLSILEIKLNNITDEIKKNEIIKELNELEKCRPYIDNYTFLYKLLLYVNKKIWDLTNIIKSIDITNQKFAVISKEIFDYNQKRFRIKNWFNILNKSEIKEQKSYQLSCCKICIREEKNIFLKNAEINMLLLEYDVIIFDTSFIETIQKCFKMPTYYFSNNTDITTVNIIDIDSYITNKEEINIFYNL
jgi:hypothetical protein